MSVNKEDSTLNGLIAASLDSADGYRTAAEQADNPELQQIFQKRATERQQVAVDLQTEMRRLGKEPEDDGTILAAIHRAYIDLRSAVIGNDELAIVNEVERGEFYINGKFEDAIMEEQLHPTTKSVIKTAYQSVQIGRNQMAELKERLGQ